MDEQVELLRGIRNEMKTLNGRVNSTNERLEATNETLDATNEKLDAMRGELKTAMADLREHIDLVHNRSVDRDLHLRSAVVELSRDIRELTLLVHDWRDEHRLDRADLRARVERLERHAGF